MSVTKTSVDIINPTNAHSFDQIGARLSGSFYNQKLSEITVWDSVIDIADVWDGSGIPIDLTSFDCDKSVFVIINMKHKPRIKLIFFKRPPFE